MSQKPRAKINALKAPNSSQGSRRKRGKRAVSLSDMQAQKERRATTERLMKEARAVVAQEKAEAQQSRVGRLRSAFAPGGLAGPDTPFGRDYRNAVAGMKAGQERLAWLNAERTKAKAEMDSVPRRQHLGLEWERLQAGDFVFRQHIERTRDDIATASRKVSQLEDEIIKRLALATERTEASPTPAGIATFKPLTWRVLPPGHLLSRAIELGTSASPGGRADISRLQLLLSLHPEACYEGSHLGQTVYFVAEFPTVAIADSPDYGNALYYCLRGERDWRMVFRLDKQEARAAGARRIVHTGDWEERIRALVRRGR